MTYTFTSENAHINLMINVVKLNFVYYNTFLFIDIIEVKADEFVFQIV